MSDSAADPTEQTPSARGSGHAPLTRESFWRATAPSIATGGVLDDRRYDVVVVGAGIAGIATALMLARTGVSVAVLEARTVGAVTTGNTSGKVSLLQSTQLSEVQSKNGTEVAAAYLEGNRRGLDWLADFMDASAVPYQRRTAYSYAYTAEGRERIESEHRLARELGLLTQLAPTSELPFSTAGAVALADQLQINSMQVLAAMVAELRHLGVAVREHYTATAVHKHDDGVAITVTPGPANLDVAHGDRIVRGDRVLIATGTPILNRGGDFARMEPLRSYTASYLLGGADGAPVDGRPDGATGRPLATELPQGMYLSVDEPSRSLRTGYDGAGREYLIVGGAGHVVGREDSAAAHVAELHAWTLEHFPGAVRDRVWSAQDYRTIDSAPYVGPLYPGQQKIFTATGFAKWGLSNGIAAALSLTAQLTGTRPPWAETLYGRRETLHGMGTLLGSGLKVGAEAVKDWAHVVVSPKPSANPSEGEGVVYRDGPHAVAASTVEGVTRRVSAVCPHLGGVLHWNDQETSWDCPLHGSRFDCAGRRLEGPARTDLPVRP